MTEREVSPRTRRAVLGLVGSALTAGVAGCSGDSDPERSSPTAAPTDTTRSTTTETVRTTRSVPSSSTTTERTTTTTSTATTESTTSRPTTTNGASIPTTTAVTPEDAHIVVAADGSAEFSSVQAGFDDVNPDAPGETVIYVHAGTYKEKLELGPDRTNVTLVGEGPDETVLTYDENARDAGGTTESATVTILADGFSAHGVTFENTAVPIAQKVALLAEGDRHFYENCRFLSHQDTIYVREPGARQYYLDCEVFGTTDFVFGDADAVFDRCDVYCRDSASVITAANTLPEFDVGIVFKHCAVDGATPSNQVSLGRPWGPYGRTAFVDCTLSDVVNTEGWSAWSGNDNHETARYLECANSGPGFTPDRRVEWATVLEPDRLGEFHLIFEEWDPLGKSE